MPPIIDKSKCVGCHTCADICPTDVYGIQKREEKIPVVRYPDECWHCNACVMDCPAKAIHLRIPVSTMLVFVDAPGK